MSLLLALGTGADHQGPIAITVPVPAIALAGVESIPGAVAITVPVPAVALAGVESIPGSLAITVPVPAVALNGSVTQTVTGSIAITVPVPAVAMAGSGGTVAGGGGRSKRHSRRVVREFPKRRRLTIPDLNFEEVPVVTGSAHVTVPPPSLRVTGLVDQAEDLDDERLVYQLATEDEDLALALTLADAWMR